MKVLYLLQTYKNPDQIKRLIKTIKKLSSSSQFLISHDSNAQPLNDEEFTCIPGVYVIYNPGGRGDFRNVQVYLNSLKWLFEHQIEFDWIVNLSVNDYPTQHLTIFEQFLSATQYDGFIEHRDVLSANNYFGIRESIKRYFYQYWHSGLYLNQWQKSLLKPIRLLVNNSQPFVKITDTYQLSIGLRACRPMFDKNFKCYGGSMHQIISKKCAIYLKETAESRIDLVEYYKKTSVPDESFMPSILANSKLFDLCDKNYFYVDWNKSTHGHPKILTVADYPTIIQRKDIFFARKFDPAVDNNILDMLDQHLLKQETANIE